MAETSAIERRRTVGGSSVEEETDIEGSNRKQPDDDDDDEYNRQQKTRRHANNATQRDGQYNEAETSSLRADSYGWQYRLKGFLIAVTVITLSYSILSETTRRPHRFSVITKMTPQHCGLNLTAKLQSLILDKHNEIRSKVALGKYAVEDAYLPPASNMPKLIWDCQLELEAQNRASECNLDNDIIDKKLNDLDEVRGENAFYFRTDVLDHSEGVVRGIAQMGNEIAVAGIKNLKLDRYDKRIGHATQIIWGATRTVGCAVQECAARQDGSLGGQKHNVAVCKYHPTGNVFKASNPTSIYTVGDIGSACSEGTFVDPASGLCVAATLHEAQDEGSRE